LAEFFIPNWVLQIVVASIGATISGVILLLVHHFRVKQELTIHRNKELFDRKQKMYHHVIKYFLQSLSTKDNFGAHSNWRIDSQIYNNLLLIGKESTIIALNRYLEQAGTGISEIELSNLFKKVLIEIRKDLYDDEKLTPNEIKFFSLTSESEKAVKIIKTNIEKLKEHDLTTFWDIAEMDVEKVKEQTGIDGETLDFLKKISKKEKDIEKEFKEFLEKE